MHSTTQEIDRLRHELSRCERELRRHGERQRQLRQNIERLRQTHSSPGQAPRVGEQLHFQGARSL